MAPYFSLPNARRQSAAALPPPEMLDANGYAPNDPNRPGGVFDNYGFGAPRIVTNDTGMHVTDQGAMPTAPRPTNALADVMRRVQPVPATSGGTMQRGDMPPVPVRPTPASMPPASMLNSIGPAALAAGLPLDQAQFLGENMQNAAFANIVSGMDSAGSPSVSPVIPPPSWGFSTASSGARGSAMPEMPSPSELDDMGGATAPAPPAVSAIPAGDVALPPPSAFQAPAPSLAARGARAGLNAKLIADLAALDAARSKPSQRAGSLGEQTVKAQIAAREAQLGRPLNAQETADIYGGVLRQGSMAGDPEQRVRLEQFAKDMDSYKEAGRAARRLIPNVNRLDSLFAEGLKTGKGEQFKTDLSAWAKAAGIPVDEKALAGSQEASALLGQSILEFFQQTKGAITDRENALFASFGPQFGKTPEANKALLTLLRNRLELDRDLEALVRQGNAKGLPIGQLQEQVNARVDRFDKSLEPISAPAATGRPSLSSSVAAALGVPAQPAAAPTAAPAFDAAAAARAELARRRAAANPQ